MPPRRPYGAPGGRRRGRAPWSASGAPPGYPYTRAIKSGTSCAMSEGHGARGRRQPRQPHRSKQ
eukprot:3216409-Prymnesium_polylepis.1